MWEIICRQMQETQETRLQFLVREDPLKEKMSTHSSILASVVPWTEEPGGLQSVGSQGVRHVWVTECAPYDAALLSPFIYPK